MTYPRSWNAFGGWIYVPFAQGQGGSIQLAVCTKWAEPGKVACS